MNDKTLSMLGLCRRAGRMTLGCDAVISSMANGEARLVLCASDISKNTYKKISAAAEMYEVDCRTLNKSREALSGALGKFCAVAAINDAGFAKTLIGYIQTESEE